MNIKCRCAENGIYDTLINLKIAPALKFEITGLKLNWKFTN